MPSSFIVKLMARGYGAGFNVLSYIHSRLAAEWALKVFATPRRGNVSDYQRDFLDAAKANQIEVDGEQIQLYHWHGTGPRVLLAHGWESNTYRWKDTVAELQMHGYDIYAVDAPAHGNSSGKRFTALRYAKVLKVVVDKIEPDSVIAHSVGAMATVYQQSETDGHQIRKLVCLGSPDTLLEIMQGYKQMVGFNQRVYDNLNQLLFDKYGYYISDFNTASFLATLEAKVLIIHAADDTVIKVKNGRKLAKVEGIKYLELSEGGHSLRQQEVRDHILAFLNA